LDEDAKGRKTGHELRVIPTERLDQSEADALAAETARHRVEEAVTHVAGRLHARPIGRPTDWLGAETTAALRAAATTTAWEWVQDQIPRVVAQIRVPEMVEQKVLGFSTQRMEEPV